MILSYLPLLITAILAATPLGKKLYAAREAVPAVRLAGILGAAALLLLCTAALASQSYNPFIYFRF